jgi:hypothetical protein
VVCEILFCTFGFVFLVINALCGQRKMVINKNMVKLTPAEIQEEQG